MADEQNARIEVRMRWIIYIPFVIGVVVQSINERTFIIVALPRKVFRWRVR